MSTGVQITLIICATIIILSIISSLEIDYKSDNKVEHVKIPTYSRPPVPGSRGLAYHDNSNLANIRRNKCNAPLYDPSKNPTKDKEGY